MKRILLILLSCITVLSCFISCTPKSNNNDIPPSEQNNDTEKLKEELKNEFLKKANEVEIKEDSVVFTDASGKTEKLTIKKNPAKTLNLYASFTTLWYEAGGKVIGCIGGSSSVELYNEYIGRDITKDEGVSVVATSSSGKKWSVEDIINLKPDLIICSLAMSGYSTIEGPAKVANIPVIAVDYNDFSDYLKWFKVFCNLTGKPELWESVAVKTLNEVVTTIAESKSAASPKVFSMFAGSKSLQANTKDTLVGAMIAQLNGKNIVDDWKNTEGDDRLEINLETVLAADPDIILVQCHAGADEARAQVADVYGNNPVWQSLRAVKEGKVFYLEKTLFHNKPNSRFSVAYKTLADILNGNSESK